jgi:hypothetical protein
MFIGFLLGEGFDQGFFKINQNLTPRRQEGKEENLWRFACGFLSILAKSCDFGAI